MINLCQKFVYFIMSVQEKLLRKRLYGTLNSTYSNSTSKTVFNNGSTLTLTSKTEKNKQKVELNVATIIKKCQNNPEKLLNFVEDKGTKVYRISHAKKLLQVVREEEGLIASAKGFKALYLNVITGNGVSLKTKPMFIIKKGKIDSYTMIHQFHKWYAMKLNLPGFDEHTQTNFKKFMNISNDKDIKDLNLDEILSLKEAIARDVEAINFVVNVAKGTEGSKKALQKMTTGGAAI